MQFRNGKISKATSLTKIRNICNKCASIRTEDDLKTLHSYLCDRTDVGTSEPLWHYLPYYMQIELCRYFRYKKYDVDTMQHLCSNKNTLFVLLWGSSELIREKKTWKRTVQEQLSHGRKPTFGCIPTLPSVRKLICQVSGDLQFFSKREKEKASPLDCHSQRSPKKFVRTSVLFHKGCQCLSVHFSDLRFFMERLFDNLLSTHILRHLNLHGLRQKSISTFPIGSPIMIEGVESNKIVLTLRGKVELSKERKSVESRLGPISSSHQQRTTIHDDDSLRTQTCISADSNLQQGNDDDMMHLAYAMPMTFLGQIPHFVSKSQMQTSVQHLPVDVETQNSSSNPQRCQRRDHQPQPMTATALTPVRALVLDANEFMKCLKQSQAQNNISIYNIFESVARRQWNWLNFVLPPMMMLEREETYTPPSPFPMSSMVELETLVRGALNDAIIDRRPRLNKSKILDTFKHLVGSADTDADDDSDIGKSREDHDGMSHVFGKSDTCTCKVDDDNSSNQNCCDACSSPSPSPMRELQRAIEDDWGEQKTATSTSKLSAFPTIIHDRKAYGKTLPLVRKSDGFQSPLFTISDSD